MKLNTVDKNENANIRMKESQRKDDKTITTTDERSCYIFNAKRLCWEMYSNFVLMKQQRLLL